MTHLWKTFFDHYAAFYGQEAFTQHMEDEIAFLITHLALQPGQQVLDLGCGIGRHAIALAQRGFKLTGVDISSGMLAQAHQAAQQTGVGVTWIEADATRFESEAIYDAAYSVCEGGLSLLSLGEDPIEHDLMILRRLYAALKPGGRALITVTNAMRWIRHYQADDIEAGRFDPLTLTEQFELSTPTPQGEKTLLMRGRGYVPTELALLMRLAGFRVEAIGSGTAGYWALHTPDLDEMELLAIGVKGS